jgi:uncharacterized caspase-like protein
MANNWAIAIGINQYEFLQPLKYAKRDAELMGEFLRNEAKFDRIFLFTADSPPVNGKSTRPFRANLLKILREIFAAPFMKDGDNFWFFFSGHGVRHREQDYLMPLDGDPEDVEHTGIPTHLITNYLRSCGADNVVLILDACRNGGKKSGEGIGRQTEAEARQTGVISIFSCSPDQYSYELEAIEQGAFTHALIEGLGIRGRCATVERLNQYLENRVPDLVSQHLERVRQTPYIIAEPLRRSHLILMPQHASLADIATLKNDAYHAQTDENWNLAERLWIRVLAAASGQDADAIRALQKIAVERHTGNSSSQLERPQSTAPSKSSKAPINPKVEPKEDTSKQSVSPKMPQVAEQQSYLPRPQLPVKPPRKTSVSRREVFSTKALQRRQARPIPWRALALLLLGYIAIGSLLYLSSAPILAWSMAGVGAMAVAVTMAVAVAVDRAWAGAMFGFGTVCLVLGVSWAMAGVGGGAVSLAGVVAWAVSLAGAMAWYVVWVVALENLLKTFTKLQTFLILVGVSSGGLGLGWLVGAGLQLMGVELPAGV